MGIIAQLRFADSCSGSAVPSGRGRHRAFPVHPRPGTAGEDDLRVINSLWGHLALLGLDSSYTEQVDRHLGELLDTTV
jgi:hypothetical protein